MPKTTPFHNCLASYNETGIWKHWSGYLAAPRYQYSTIAEYYSIRNSVGVLDTSPLFKYRIWGADALSFMQSVMTRDIGTCKIGSAQYTCWSNPEGFVLQDGVVLRITKNEFLVTSGEASLHYFRSTASKLGFSAVEIEDLTDTFGILAVQGPHSYNVISQLTDAADELNYFDFNRAEIEGSPVIVSRTGYTGDLGYELWIRSDDAERVFKSLMAAGQDYNITPLGLEALKMARVEAGLLLLDVDFHSARFAWVDAQRETPIELGWRWMLRNLANDSRDFIGRAAIETQMNERSNRWTTVGLSIDWHDYERLYHEAGIKPPKFELYCESTRNLYRRGTYEWDYAGYVTSFLYSPILKRPIAIAKLPNDLAKPGTEVDLEIQVIKQNQNALARVQRMPFFNPARKTEMQAQEVAR